MMRSHSGDGVGSGCGWGDGIVDRVVCPGRATAERTGQDLHERCVAEIPVVRTETRDQGGETADTLMPVGNGSEERR